ncbi:hypothetical protein ANCCAN_06139 [Ancylostoma caninum]|uniref:Uncharacterized protein n=1 Tax=Ancylostoma caninum TaxID=29170 RepID=A0A368GTV7_ANCCA|nr:hypothetical protein ANCCAN_06139 [Ancylostoma caninum]
MNLLSELYEKLKRKLTIEQRKPSGSQSSLSKTSRSQSVRETSTRPKVSTTSTVVVRPRAGTEIIIERRRCSKSLSVADNNARATLHKKLSRQATPTADSARRRRADSAPSAAFIPTRRQNPSHLSLVSTGTILAPTYRSRTATLGRPATLVRVTVE